MGLVSQKMENKKERQKLTIASAPAFLAVLPLIFMTASGCARREAPASVPGTAVATESINDFRLKQMRGGKVAWELKASSASFLTEDEVALENPVLRIPQEGGASSVVRAARGRVVMSTSEIQTFGDTELTGPDKIVRATDIVYIPSEDKISTSKGVVIITPDSEIRGDSMVSDSRLEVITLTNQRVKLKK
ncbi:MAG: LPS export ABC transporter periplasmic protein LptC [Elusimicrobia bacterium HGW-Elusimicrobia-1]|jgi:LPS export ABC transporter protein LptC|nr:MAG: LPS export ABC transporter periplasmic protein LptC [Elusimicrobia bacterium HGW-Elusimicrobia-1]